MEAQPQALNSKEPEEMKKERDSITGYAPLTRDLKRWPKEQARNNQNITGIKLEAWPTAALMGFALKRAGPIVIGAIHRAACENRLPSHIMGYLSRDELFDLLYLTTGIQHKGTYQASAEAWIYEKLQPVSIHGIHSATRGRPFDPRAWKQAAQERARQGREQSRPDPLRHIKSPASPDTYPTGMDTPWEMHLGEWNVDNIFCLAITIAGQALLGALVQKGWNSDTFLQATWGFEWEELAALIYLTTEYRMDRRYKVTTAHFFTVIMQPRHMLRLHHAVRGNIYDTGTWIAVAHSRLDQELP